MSKPLTRQSIVEVEWIDSCRQDGWTTWESCAPAVCRSAGYLLEKTDKQISVALSLGDDTNHVCGTMTIPREAVRRIRRLR